MEVDLTFNNALGHKLDYTYFEDGDLWFSVLKRYFPVKVEEYENQGKVDLYGRDALVLYTVCSLSGKIGGAVERRKIHHAKIQKLD